MARRRSPIRLLARGIVWAGLALLALFVSLVALYAVARPVSTLMLARTIEGKGYQRIYAPLKTIAPTALATVIASEDASFCDNDGVDWGALREVVSGAGEHGPSRGASTITMQTAKNLFLWPGRSVIRKGVEIPMALVLGKAWSKARTLEIYLNIAEWGDGLYGIEAAASAISTRAQVSSIHTRPRSWRLRCRTRLNAIPRIPRPFSAASPPAWKRRRAKTPICSIACPDRRGRLSSEYRNARAGK